MVLQIEPLHILTELIQLSLPSSRATRTHLLSSWSVLEREETKGEKLELWRILQYHLGSKIIILNEGTLGIRASLNRQGTTSSMLALSTLARRMAAPYILSRFAVPIFNAGYFRRRFMQGFWWSGNATFL